MTSFLSYILLFLLNKFAHAEYNGHFFKTTADGLHEIKEQPIITYNIFDCSRQKSCATVVPNVKPNEEDDKFISTDVALKKVYDPSAKYSSCGIALKLNGNTEGHYNIKNSNMLDSIEVECKVINKTTYAIIHHDNEVPTDVIGYERSGSFRRQIKYTGIWTELMNFVTSSIMCRQFTKFDCNAALINSDSGVIVSYLVDRNRQAMRYIGGGPTDGKGCECGITNTCATNGTVCNCDTNDYIWRQDKGYVSDKQRLPLTEVRIGDTGDQSEMMRYTIGPVECQGEL